MPPEALMVGRPLAKVQRTTHPLRRQCQKTTQDASDAQITAAQVLETTSHILGMVGEANGAV